MSNDYLFEDEDDETVLTDTVPDSDEVPCAIHGQPLELKKQGSKIIGICRCNVSKNTYAGKTVYEAAVEE